jgi:hypothetical protein
VTAGRIGLLAIAAAAMVLPASPAQASGLPPVTRPDAVTVTINSRVVVVNLTANDTDPEGDRLYSCGTTTTRPQGVGILEGNRNTQIYASTFPGPTDSAGASPGTYVVGTVVCDDTSVVPSTLTITVLPSPGDFVDITRKRPGKLRVFNGNDTAVQYLWGAEGRKRADGRVDIPAHASKTIRIQRRSLFTLVLAGGEYAVGVERHLRPPTDGSALPPGVEHGHTEFHSYTVKWLMNAIGA